MKTIQIKNIFDKVLFEHTCENNTTKTTLELAVRKRIKLHYANLANADLEGADLKNAFLDSANLENSYLTNANLENTNLINTNLYKAYLENANFKNSILYKTNLEGAYLENANLENANLKDSNLENANLKGAYLENAYLENAYLKNANLKGVKDYHSFFAYDTSKRTVHCFKNNNTWMVHAGCFWGSLEELETKVLETHKSKVYLMNIEILKTLT